MLYQPHMRKRRKPWLECGIWLPRFQHINYTTSRHMPPCVCVCVCGRCVFNRLEGWFKNRMFSHSSVSKTHLFSPYWPAVSSFLLHDSMQMHHKLIWPKMQKKKKRKKRDFKQRGEKPWFFTSPYSSSSPHRNRHTYLQPRGTIIKEVCILGHF